MHPKRLSCQRIHENRLNRHCVRTSWMNQHCIHRNWRPASIEVKGTAETTGFVEVGASAMSVSLPIKSEFNRKIPVHLNPSSTISKQQTRPYASTTNFAMSQSFILRPGLSPYPQAAHSSVPIFERLLLKVLSSGGNLCVVWKENNVWILLRKMVEHRQHNVSTKHGKLRHSSNQLELGKI